MRKAMSLFVTGCLIVAVLALPGFAGKKKSKQRTHRVSESVTVTLAPAPGVGDGGCAASGLNDVTKHTHPFVAPGTGTLAANLTGYTGNWDLYVLNGDGSVIAKSAQTESPVYPATESLVTKLRKGTEVGIVACNFAGGPTGRLAYVYTYRGPASGGGHHH